MNREQFRAAVKKADFAYSFSNGRAYKVGKAGVDAIEAAAKGNPELEADLAAYWDYVNECYEKGSAGAVAPF